MDRDRRGVIGGWGGAGVHPNVLVQQNTFQGAHAQLWQTSVKPHDCAPMATAPSRKPGISYSSPVTWVSSLLPSGLPPVNSGQLRLHCVVPACMQPRQSAKPPSPELPCHSCCLHCNIQQCWCTPPAKCSAESTVEAAHSPTKDLGLKAKAWQHRLSKASPAARSETSGTSMQIPTRHAWRWFQAPAKQALFPLANQQSPNSTVSTLESGNSLQCYNFSSYQQLLPSATLETHSYLTP